ncbi:NLRC3 [Symbiodinium sp. CCMP2592]|nr:NLRC3 [Symbiodinium sp. CCMP2592]
MEREGEQKKGESSSTLAADERRFKLNCLEDFLQYAIEAGIAFVKPRFLVSLDEAGGVWPRRQEAEQLPGALYHPHREDKFFKFIAISHVWESREHPDPYGFQLNRIANAVCYHQVLDSAVLFIDYMSLPQFERQGDGEELSFQRSMQHMHLLYANGSADFCMGVWRIPCLSPCPRLHRFVYGTLMGCSIPVYSAPVQGVVNVPLSKLVPSEGGSCGEFCSQNTCPNLHANRTPYVRRGWCRAELEWARPDTLDISRYGQHWRYLALCAHRLNRLWTDLEDRIIGDQQNRAAFGEGAEMTTMMRLAMVKRARCRGTTLMCVCCMYILWKCAQYVLTVSLLSCVLAYCIFITHALQASTTLPLTPDAFQKETEGQLVFTHRSDVKPVLRLQKQLFIQKSQDVTSLSCEWLSRRQSSELLGLLLQYSSLRSFNLAKSSLESAVSLDLLTCLMSRTSLRQLTLDCVALNVACVEVVAHALQNGSLLYKLSLADAGLGDAETVLLADSLRANSTLCILDLRCNRVGDSGAAALAGAMVVNRSLRSLDLSFNCIGIAGASCFVADDVLRVRSAVVEYRMTSPKAGLALDRFAGFVMWIAFPKTLVLCLRSVQDSVFYSADRSSIRLQLGYMSFLMLGLPIHRLAAFSCGMVVRLRQGIARFFASLRRRGEADGRDSEDSESVEYMAFSDSEG